MNLREFECFIAVAEELHFGRAAERLHLAQPTVSESVRRLERTLGGDLFDRSTRNVALTEFGKAFLDEARHAYQQVAAAYQTGRLLANRRSEQFLIGHAPEDERLLVTLTAELRRRHPRLTVVLEEMNTLEQVEALRHQRIDAGLGWMPEADCGLGSMVVGTCAYVAVVLETDPLARHKGVPLTRVATEPLITWPRAVNPAMYDRFATAMDATHVPWSLVATATGVANLASRVMSGQGVGVVPAGAIVHRDFAGLAYVPIIEGSPLAERTLIWNLRSPHLLMATFSRVVLRALRQSYQPVGEAAG